MRVGTVDKDTIQHYGRHLLNTYRDVCQSFEEAAQAICEDCYQEFRDEKNEPEFALIRVFRSTSYSDLSLNLKQRTSTHQTQLALMGTMGMEAAWTKREKSQNRQLIPIGEKMSPMFQGVFKELGFKLGDFQGDVAGHSVHSMQMLRYFYVGDASQSNAITDQDSFVKPYGIQSVLAVGTQFLSRQAYVLIGFSRYPISQSQAETIAEIAPFVSTLLAIFDGRKAYWAS